MGDGPVRIALVGAGRMGSVHLVALRSSQAIELAASDERWVRVDEVEPA